MAYRLASLTNEDWLTVICSLDEALLDRIMALTPSIDSDSGQCSVPAIEGLIKVGSEINRVIIDSEKYHRIPESIRGFFESHGLEAHTLAIRLLESANARLQVDEIRRRLMDLSAREECRECNLRDAIKDIEKVLSSSYLDFSP